MTSSSLSTFITKHLKNSISFFRLNKSGISKQILVFGTIRRTVIQIVAHVVNFNINQHSDIHSKSEYNNVFVRIICRVNTVLNRELFS